MVRPVHRIAPLLFCSGAAALLYQMVWLRELRLIFGASTSASAAVLAMFMGGLGAGGLVLGKRADVRRDPLMLYANLELGVAGLTALTPFLVDGSRWLYSALGGTVTLGLAGGTVVRLLLSAFVLVPVTFLMGGTLPAAAKAAETEDDPGRRHLALLYGVNTLGAVVGCLFTTFFLLEVFGGRLLLWMGCLLNALLGILARGIARDLDDEPAPARASGARAPAGSDDAAAPASSPTGEGDGPASPREEAPSPGAPAEPVPASGRAGAASAPPPGPVSAPVPAVFVLAAAAIVGFAFFLMELVFYRMLGPLLGGSTYTFGLILVFALLGVGLGGAVYSIWFKGRPATVHAFALTCLLEALCFLVPFALGDRLALLALSLRPLSSLGFGALAAGWAVIAAIVVLPAAFVSGVQFPMLMALLGRGRADVGRHVGLAYAWNTVGSIAGSLAGGFGLLPWLTAPGVWRATAVILAALGAAAAVLAFRLEKRRLSLLGPAAIVAAVVLLVRATGPTAGFRHSPIGAGRSDAVLQGATANSLRDWLAHRRRSIVWEAEGVESSVALSTQEGYNFVVNGKVDGHVRLDAGTQVMSGLIGAALHPSPRRALIVGLGTGSTAGWLGQVPTMERVDVVELEPAILHVARASAPVNRAVLDNPRVAITIGDAREVLLTTKERYDIIFSEPSNPYRAGIASLFTRELYRVAAERLTERGVFIQWLQAYDIDGQTARTAMATLASVFPSVEVFQTQGSDLLLVASLSPIEYDAAALRARLAEEPYRTAMTVTWRAAGLEALLAHHAANDSLVRAVLEQEKGNLSTDDHNILEHAFARTVGRDASFEAAQVFELSAARREDRPDVLGQVDWALVDDLRMQMFVAQGRTPVASPRFTESQLRWVVLWDRYRTGDWSPWLAAWQSEGRTPRSLLEMEILAEAHAEAGRDDALPVIEALRALQPVEADALLARLHVRKGRLREAADAAVAAIEGYRADPWPDPGLMRRFIDLAVGIGTADRAQGKRLFDALKEPFSAHLAEDDRLRARVRLAVRTDFPGLCREAYSAYEPHVPFQHAFLKRRLECYALHDDPKKAAAEADLLLFLDDESLPFRAGLEEELTRPADPADPGAAAPSADRPGAGR